MEDGRVSVFRDSRFLSWIRGDISWTISYTAERFFTAVQACTQLRLIGIGQENRLETAKSTNPPTCKDHCPRLRNETLGVT